MEGTTSVICSSSKKLKITDTESSDRLSELPESLLQQILSSLDTMQAVHTSLLSRTWRYTWRSVSNLTLDHSWILTSYPYVKPYRYYYRRGPQFRKLSFPNFVDHVLPLIDNCNVKKLHMNCGSYWDKDKVKEWLSYSLRKLNVKEIYLEIISTESSHTLPKFLFTSAITKFVLHSSEVYSRSKMSWELQAFEECGRVKLPKSMCLASQLRTLELISAILPKGNSERKLILRCPVLENLVINNCDHHDLKVVNICAPELKTLDIHNNCLDLFGGCAIHICTPNLETLSLKGYLYKDYQVEKLSSMVSADIVISGHLDVKGSPSLKHLVNILKGIYSVRTLHLHNQRFQLANSHHKLERLPAEFSNLRCLKMTWSGNSCVQVITNILRSAHIETLVLEVIKACFDKKSFEEESLFQTMFCHLKYIEIQKLLGTPNELRILECLLKYAMVLQKLTITLSELLLTNREKAEIICKSLTSFPTASSNVKIQFLEERDGADFSI